MEVICKREDLKHSKLTEAIIGTFYDVYNELGHGFSGIGLSRSHGRCV